MTRDVRKSILNGSADKSDWVELTPEQRSEYRLLGYEMILTCDRWKKEQLSRCLEVALLDGEDLEDRSTVSDNNN